MVKKILLLCVLSIILLLSGCWDSIEIEDQFLVMAMGWDQAENPEQMILSLSSPTTTQGAPENVIVVSVATYSVESGLHQAQEITYRNIELGHLRILIVGEEFAKKGIQKHIDSIGRNPRVGRETLIVVLEGKAKNLWELNNPATPRPVEYLVQMIKTNEKFNLSLASTFRDFFEDISREGTEPVTAYLRITEDKQSYNSNGVAAFCEGKMVGTLLGSEFQAYLMVSGKSRSGSITLGKATVNPDDNSTTFMYRRSKTTIKTKIVNNQPHVSVKVLLEGDITEYTSTEPVNDKTIIAMLEKSIEDVESSIIKKTIQKCQKEYKTDIFGLGEYFRAYHPQWWNQHQWHDEFPNIKVDVEVEANIRRIGIES